MKRFYGLVLFASLIFFSFKYAGISDGGLEIGNSAVLTTYEMEATNGDMVTLDGIKKQNGCLVIFSCNTCPFVVGNEERAMEGWQGRYNEIKEYCDKYKIGMILVNSNEAKRNNGDNMDDMIDQVTEQNFTATYALDENHQLADAFGAMTTPHVYLFDGNWILRYKGLIDDNYEQANKVKEPYLKKAIKSMAKGKEIETASTKSIGCSIKRVED